MDSRSGRRSFPEPVANDITLSAFDVISGKGVTRANHPGNERFRALVRVCSDGQYNSYSSSEKRAMASEVIQHIERMGGRFLKKVTGASRGLDGPWEVLSDEDRFKKTKQALRDCNRSDREGYANALSIPEDVQQFKQNILANSDSMKEHFAKAANQAQQEAEVHAAAERISSSGSFHSDGQPSAGSFVSPILSGPSSVASMAATPAGHPLQPPYKKQKVTPTPAAAEAPTMHHTEPHHAEPPMSVYTPQGPFHLTQTNELQATSLALALSQHEQQHAASLDANLHDDPQNHTLSATDFDVLRSAFSEDEDDAQDDAKESILEDTKPSASSLAANLAAIEGSSSLPGFSGSPLRHDGDSLRHEDDDGVLDPGSLF